MTGSILRWLLTLALPLAVAAACGTESEPVSPLDTSLDPTGVAVDCPDGAISQGIAAIFPTKKRQRHVATVHCGEIFRDFGAGNQPKATQKAFQFFQKTLEQKEAGKLLDPDPSVEARIVELFSAIFAQIGFEIPVIEPQVLMDGEYAIGELVPGGPPLLTVSRHAGIDDGGALLGPVSVFIVQIHASGGDESGLAAASESHPCPADINDSFDCYPLFFDYSVTPASNVNPDSGLQLGQCNVSPSGVEVQLLTPEGFLEEDDAPTGVVCDVGEEGVAMTGWRSYAWALIEPISPLFRVTPAIAGRNPIGGRISAFSPVAPADPNSGGEPTLGSISGRVFDESDDSSIQGATVELFTPRDVAAGSTTTNSDGVYSFSGLELGDYQVKASAEGVESDSSAPFTLTEEAPNADVDIGLSPSVSREIFFSTNRDGPFDIWAVGCTGSFGGASCDGSDLRQVTSAGPNEFNLKVSPDGTRIAYEGILDGKFEIFIMEVDGSSGNGYNLTNSTGNDGLGAWLPDGSGIVFHSDRDGDYEVYVVDIDGTDLTQLTMNAVIDRYPDVSPSGDIVFESNRDGNGEIYVMAHDGMNPTRLTDRPGFLDTRPSWNPDPTANEIAFQTQSTTSHIFRMPVTFAAAATDLGEGTAPDWGDIGIAFIRAGTSGGDDIWVMNEDGTNATNLTQNPATDWFPTW